MEPITTKQLIDELEKQMPNLVAAIEQSNFILAAELMTQREELLHQLTMMKTMTLEQKEYVRRLCINITQQHEKWVDELAVKHQSLADELKVFSARNNATQQYKNNR